MAKKLLTGADLNNQRLVNVADPSSSTDGVNLQYLQNFVRGLSWKQPVRAASVSNVSLTSPGASLDGVSLAAGDRILLKDQSTASQNGIYVWQASGSALTRANDADTGAKILGTSVLVMEGTTNADRQYVLTTDGTITIGTTALAFAQFGGGITYTAGNGLALSGTTFSVNPASGGGILVAAGGVSVDTTIVTRKYATAIGDGSATSYTVTHNLGTRDVTYVIYNASTYEVVDADVVLSSATALTVTFASAPASGAYRVVVTG